MNWLVVLYTPWCCTLWPATGGEEGKQSGGNKICPKSHQLTFCASLRSISANRFNPRRLRFMIRPSSFLEIRYLSVVVSVTSPVDDVPLPTAPDCTTTAGWKETLWLSLWLSGLSHSDLPSSWPSCPRSCPEESRRLSPGWSACHRIGPYPNCPRSRPLRKSPQTLAWSDDAEVRRSRNMRSQVCPAATPLGPRVLPRWWLSRW